MLICLGGFLGSGRRLLAQQLSNKIRFHYYDIGIRKSHAHARNARREVVDRVINPNSDVDRAEVYRKVLQDLPLISKMHQDVIIDDVFHRKAPRDFFLFGARKIFGTVFFIWVESSEDYVTANLEHMAAQGIIQNVRVARERREKTRREYEPVPPATPRFEFDGSLANSTERLTELIQKMQSRM